MLDLVPLAGARREVADLQRQAQVVGQLLQRHLPQPAAAAVAAAAVGGDQQFAGLGEAPAAHLLPPAADAVGGELGRVVVDPHAHPALVAGQVVDAVGDRLAQLLVREVMDLHLLGLAPAAAIPGRRS